MATPATAQTIPAGRLRRLPALNRYVNVLGPLVMIFALSLIMAIVEPNYFRVSNLMIILQDASVYMIVGMGMTMVITGRGIDLSIGATAALSAIVMAMLIKDFGFGPYSGMAVALLVGLACGTANGLVITRLHVPDLIATLSMDLVFRGIALVLAAGAVLARFPDPIPMLGRGRLFELVPVPAIIGLITLAVGYVILRRTPLGRYAMSAGSGLKHIHLEHFRRFFIPLPPLEEQQRLIQVQQSWERDFASADSHLLKLRHLRTALLRDLLTPPVAAAAEPRIAAE